MVDSRLTHIQRDNDYSVVVVGGGKGVDPRSGMQHHVEMKDLNRVILFCFNIW